MEVLARDAEELPGREIPDERVAVEKPSDQGIDLRVDLLDRLLDSLAGGRFLREPVPEKAAPDRGTALRLAVDAFPEDELLLADAGPSRRFGGGDAVEVSTDPYVRKYDEITTFIMFADKPRFPGRQADDVIRNSRM